MTGELEVVTTNVNVVVCVDEPLVPVTVTVELPSGVLVDALSVSEEVPDPLIELGLNDGVTPDGRPLILKVTVPANWPRGFTTMSTIVWLPGTRFCVVGAADSEKSGDTVIVRVGGFGSVTPELSVTVRDAT